MIVKKTKVFIDYNLEKEENWINDQRKDGLELLNVGLRYHFIKRDSEDECPLVKIDYQPFLKKEDYINYSTLFEDSGWIMIAGGRYANRQYFKRIDKNASEDIFSDRDSKAARFKRMSNSYLTLALCYFPIAVSLMMTSELTLASLLNPASLYYTPGLWDSSGSKFIIMFLIETPFVLLRALSVLIFPILILLFLWTAYKSHKFYKKDLTENL